MACTTVEIVPPPTPPALIRVVHPEAWSASLMTPDELTKLFLSAQAPTDTSFYMSCDQDVRKLYEATKSVSERVQGIRELILRSPVAYHWCFYGKLRQIEQDLQKDSLFQEKKKRILEAYVFLAPVAKVFAESFHDSRYLRWASVRYQRTSGSFLFRKVDFTPEGTSLLVEASHPLGLWHDETSSTVLDRYKLKGRPDLSVVAVGMPKVTIEQEALPSLVSAEPEAAPAEDAVVTKEIPE